MNQDPSTMALAPRILPELDEHNRPFWTRGAQGDLTIQWCSECDRWVHPPNGSCPQGHTGLEPRVVSGDGTVFTFTINRHAFHPAVPPPYIVAIVELVEQADLRMIANIVECPVDGVTVGMRVRVRFEPHGDVHVPVFVPV
jgi:uncharacterized protein